MACPVLSRPAFGQGVPVGDPDPAVGTGEVAAHGQRVVLRVVVQDHDLQRPVPAGEKGRDQVPQVLGLITRGHEHAHERTVQTRCVSV